MLNHTINAPQMPPVSIGMATSAGYDLGHVAVRGTEEAPIYFKLYSQLSEIVVIIVMLRVLWRVTLIHSPNAMF